jgi:hypothetical protein
LGSKIPTPPRNETWGRQGEMMGLRTNFQTRREGGREGGRERERERERERGGWDDRLEAWKGTDRPRSQGGFLTALLYGTLLMALTEGIYTSTMSLNLVYRAL